MSDNSEKLERILISGGGTGGHIFPALSIAEAIRRRNPDCKILFVGAQGRMEMERVPAAGYEIVGLPVAGFDRKRLWRNIPVLFKLWRSMRRARRLVRQFRPQLAIGVGGYASGPTLKAAQRAGIPTLLQEQNSYPGVTNKLLGKKARKVCVAYEEARRFFPEGTVVMTGNPVRPALLECPLSQAEAKRSLGFDPARPLVLVTGGSLGARTLNQCMGAGLDSLLDGKTQVLWQTGKSGREMAQEAVRGRTDVKASAFISDMAAAYRAADLVVARAGAGTISELQLLGKAAVLVPSPNVAEDHQRKNAQALADHDAAVMIPDAEAREKLVPEIKELMQKPAMRQRLSENILRMALRDSADKIADIALSIINDK